MTKGDINAAMYELIQQGKCGLIAYVSEDQKVMHYVDSTDRLPREKYMKFWLELLSKAAETMNQSPTKFVEELQKIMKE